MSDHLDRLMRKVDTLEQDNKRLFERLRRVESEIAKLNSVRLSQIELDPDMRLTPGGFLDD